MEASEILVQIYTLDPHFNLKEYLEKHLEHLRRKQELHDYMDWIIENMDE